MATTTRTGVDQVAAGARHHQRSQGSWENCQNSIGWCLCRQEQEAEAKVFTWQNRLHTQSKKQKNHEGFHLFAKLALSLFQNSILTTFEVSACWWTCFEAFPRRALLSSTSQRWGKSFEDARIFRLRLTKLRLVVSFKCAREGCVGSLLSTVDILVRRRGHVISFLPHETLRFGSSKHTSLKTSEGGISKRKPPADTTVSSA